MEAKFYMGGSLFYILPTIVVHRDTWGGFVDITWMKAHLTISWED